MRSKYKYVLKYICFRFIPDLVYIGLISAILIFLSTVNNKHSELNVAVFLSAIALAILLAHYVYNIIKFLRMIKLQERQYNVTFDDTNLNSFAKWGLWVICSDSWLFSPGRFAIYKKEISSASISEALAKKGGVVYPLKIKTISGKTFKLKLKNETDARFLKNWARKP